MEKEEAKRLVKKLIAAYPNWKPDKDTAEIWAEEFMETTDARVATNIKDWLRRGEKFMPSLAEIIAPHPDIEAQKETDRTLKMLEEQEQRKKKAVPPPWVQKNMTWKQWWDQLPKESERK